MANQQTKGVNVPVALAFVGIMFFSIGFALGINSFLIPVLKTSFSIQSWESYLILTATFLPFIIFGYPASRTIAAIGYKRTMAFSFLLFALGFGMYIVSAHYESFAFFIVASFIAVQLILSYRLP